MALSTGNGNLISISDVDAGANDVQVELTGTNGVLTLSSIVGLSFSTGTGTAEFNMVFTGTMTDINAALDGLQYDPLSEYSGVASIQIITNDQGFTGAGGVQSDTDTVSITVTIVNDAPVISDAGDAVNFQEGDNAVTLDGDISVADVDSANLVAAWVNITENFENTKDELEFPGYGNIGIGSFSNGPGLGSLELTGTDTVANYIEALRMVKFNNTDNNPTFGIRTITWNVTDGQDTSINVTSTLSLTAVNDPPVAVNDSGTGFITDEETAFTTEDVRINDSDPEDFISVYSLDDAFITGQVTNSTGGRFYYEPNGQFEYLAVGEQAFDFFNYSLTDGDLFDTAMVTITINGVNDAPVLDSIGNQIIDESWMCLFTATASDIELDGLTFSLEPGAPAGASITAGGDFSWTPSEAQGPDFFNITIRVTDDGTPNLYDNETIMFTVNEYNEFPVLDPIGNKNVNELATLAFTATASDSDIPVNSLTFGFMNSVPPGASITPDGDFTWTPTEAQGPGVYSITINVLDDGTPIRGDFEVIQVFVSEVNEAPSLDPIGDQTVDEETELTFTATANDPDLPANTLTFTLDPGAPPGASISSGGAFSWTPTEDDGPGNYAVTIRVSDGEFEDFETINIEVIDVNVAPAASDDSATVYEDSGADNIDVLANDQDHDNDTFTIIAVTQGTNGTVTITDGGANISYEPDADFFGTDTFTYTINDGELNGTATVTVTVENVNDDPIAVDDAASVDEDSSTTVYVLDNDGFAPDDEETLTIDSVTQGTHGTVTIASGDTRVIYEPDADYFGTDTFTYTISDGNGGESTATVTMTVENVNDAPIIDGTGIITAMDGDVYNVDFDVDDIDGDTISWSVSGAEWLTINSAGVLNGSAETGTYTIRVTASDGNGGTDTFSFKLTVEQRDSDDDGVPDGSDAFPDNANETVDTDRDGIGNNEDSDDDDDGEPDITDDFPLDDSETTDTDGDVIGNNVDTDDDGDGVLDVDDPEPLDGSINGNEYVSGWPYWYVLAVIGIAALIGIICLGAVWLLRRI